MVFPPNPRVAVGFGTRTVSPGVWSVAGRKRVGWLGRMLFPMVILLGMCGSASAFVAVRDGLPDCTLQLAEDASPAERYAASELNGGLERITGKRLSLRESDTLPPDGKCILLGRGKWLSQGKFRECRENLDVAGAQGFVLQTVGSEGNEMLVVAGGSPRATVYAVFALLERIGMRWYAKDVTRAPHLRTINLGAVSEADFPCFDIRGIAPCGADSPEWRAHLRLNAGRGLLEDRFGCEPVYVPLDIPLGDLLPGSLIERHPEYFPLIGGSRSREFNLCCLSNPQVIRLVSEGISARLANAPGVTHVRLLFDAREMVCQCPACTRAAGREGNSGLVLAWVNAVADAVARGHRNVHLETAPSWTTAVAPKYGRPHASTVIRLYGEDLSMAQPFSGMESGAGADFTRALKYWTGVSERVYVAFPVAFLNHPAAPFPFLRTAARNLDLCRERFAGGAFFESPAGETVLSPDREMNAWVLSRLMWDADLPVDALVREWMKGVYGSASGAMFDYWRHLQAAGERSRVPVTASGGPLPLFDDRWIADADRMMQRAYALSLADRTANRYVRKARLGLWYVRLLRMREVNAGKPMDADSRAGYLELLDRFARDFRESGYTRVTGNQSLAQFIAEMRNLPRSGAVRR